MFITEDSEEKPLTSPKKHVAPHPAGVPAVRVPRCDAPTKVDGAKVVETIDAIKPFPKETLKCGLMRYMGVSVFPKIIVPPNHPF